MDSHGVVKPWLSCLFFFATLPQSLCESDRRQTDGFNGVLCFLRKVEYIFLCLNSNVKDLSEPNEAPFNLLVYGKSNIQAKTADPWGSVGRVSVLPNQRLTCGFEVRGVAGNSEFAVCQIADPPFALSHFVYGD